MGEHTNGRLSNIVGVITLIGMGLAAIAYAGLSHPRSLTIAGSVNMLRCFT